MYSYKNAQVDVRILSYYITVPGLEITPSYSYIKGCLVWWKLLWLLIYFSLVLFLIITHTNKKTV